jgi:hypothetical protein
MAKCCGFGNSYSFITPNVPPTPITEGDTEVKNYQVSGVFTIPKGCIKVSIKNIGLSDGLVQGNIYPSGNADYIDQAFYSPAENKVYMTPDIVLDATGTLFQVIEYRPI